MIVEFLVIWRRWNFQLLTIAYLLTTGFSANATTCNLMNKLTKRPLLMEVTQPYSADNPMVNTITIFSIMANNTTENTVIAWWSQILV
ncbi:hypothetical protein [Arsenophonus sp.]|uniref:hypothetical protein n=1 Tax=Arsenophonus sp. TaxID=1872640 RepID=UPI0038795A15